MKSSLALEYAFPGCDASAELSYSTLSCHRISKFSVSGRKLGMSLLWLCFIPGVFADKCVSTEEQKNSPTCMSQNTCGIMFYYLVDKPSHLLLLATIFHNVLHVRFASSIFCVKYHIGYEVIIADIIMPVFSAGYQSEFSFNTCKLNLRMISFCGT